MPAEEKPFLLGILMTVGIKSLITLRHTAFWLTLWNVCLMVFKITYPIKKCAEDLNRHFSEEDIDGQEAHEKMFKVANH